MAEETLLRCDLNLSSSAAAQLFASLKRTGQGLQFEAHGKGSCLKGTGHRLTS